MTKQAYKRLRQFLSSRPLDTISTVLSIKDAALGLGFILAPYEITQTLVYQGIAALLPAAMFGWFLLIVALVTAGFALANKTKTARVGLEFMALFWLFTTFIYLLSSAPILMVVGVVFSFLPGYISFYYKFEEVWNERKWRVRGQPEGQDSCFGSQRPAAPSQ